MLVARLGAHYEFLHMSKRTKLASMNAIILFSDAFMQAVIDDAEYELTFDVEATGRKIAGRSRPLFDEYCQTQWDWGVGASSRTGSTTAPLSGYATNTRSEVTNLRRRQLVQPRLYSFIEGTSSAMRRICRRRFRAAVRTAVRALDEVLDYGFDAAFGRKPSVHPRLASASDSGSSASPTPSSHKSSPRKPRELRLHQACCAPTTEAARTSPLSPGKGDLRQIRLGKDEEIAAHPTSCRRSARKSMPRSSNTACGTARFFPTAPTGAISLSSWA